MALPAPRTYVASEFISATILNTDVRDVHNFILEPPRVFVYKSGSGSIGAGLWDELNFDGELYDPYSTPAHDPATNNSRVHARENGLYAVFAQVRFTGIGGTAGVRGLQVRKGAAGVDTAGTRLAIEHRDVTGGGQATIFGLNFDTPLNSGDYIESFAFNGDSASRTVDGGSGETFLGMRWVAKL